MDDEKYILQVKELSNKFTKLSDNFIEENINYDTKVLLSIIIGANIVSLFVSLEQYAIKYKELSEDIQNCKLGLQKYLRRTGKIKRISEI